MLALMTDAYGGYGGIAQYNQDFSGVLDRWDKVARILILPRITPDQRVAPGGKIDQRRAIRGRILYSVNALWTALRLRPDVVFCGHLYHGRLARLIAALVGARVVSQVHGIEAWDTLPRKTIAALRAAELILCVSNDTRRRLIEQEATLASTSAVVPNTVGAAFTPGDRAAARARFGVGDDFVLLSVGRLDVEERYKGHDRIIPLLRGLPVGDRPLRYIVAGKGPDRARLERLAAEHKVSDLVHFLDSVPGEALPDLYRAADLFALPSTGEGFGIVFIEAMACGTPAIGLDVGGAGDALCNGELGIAVTPDAFPEALDRAVRVSGRQSPEDRLALAARVHAKFGHAAFDAKVKAVLEPLFD